MKRLIRDDNLSNLTSASGEVSASSGSRTTETGNNNNFNNNNNMYSFASTNDLQQNQQQQPPQPPPPQKKKRNLPGNPDPEAEVIALSPKSLLATNRFVCEVCSKGFQRDQNLQLHRRGHNLPWKLKQRTNKDVVKKKVYICPEVTCVHHDPSRALGDLTGIKKHFCRKHGEKKWKCEKCSKRYAVQSDWRAHSKICGTREYRCDCGTLFSRRDSFITHRAFCDALAEESARAITNTINHSFPSSSSSSHQQSPQPNMINLQALTAKREQFEQNHVPLFINPTQNSNHSNNVPSWLCNEQQQQINFQTQLFQTGLDQNHHHHSTLLLQHETDNPNPNGNNSQATSTAKLLSQFLPTSATSAAAAAAHLVSSPHMSATALLQKAAQMGVTMSSNKTTPSPLSLPSQPLMSQNTAGLSSSFSPREDRNVVLNRSNGFVHDMVYDDMLLMSNPKLGSHEYQESHDLSSKSKPSTTDLHSQLINCGGGGGNDGLTRDFLGLKPFSHGDFMNIHAAGLLGHITSSSSSSSNQQQLSPWHG